MSVARGLDGRQRLREFRRVPERPRVDLRAQECLADAKVGGVRLVQLEELPNRLQLLVLDDPAIGVVMS